MPTRSMPFALALLATLGGGSATPPLLAQLTALGAALLHQCDASQPINPCETGDRFGNTAAVGDFNGDGFDDLAVGSPTEDLQGLADRGAVEIYYGGPAGVGGTHDLFLHGGVGGFAQNDLELFGAALAAGDFDGDGFDDLAIGVPGRDRLRCTVPSGNAPRTGAVRLFFGSVSGLDPASGGLIDQCSLDAGPHVGIFNLDHDGFGRALAACRHSSLAYDKLVVGAPFKDTSLGEAKTDVGFVYQVDVSGSLAPGKLQPTRVITQPLPGLADGSEAGDQFGRALACADFNGDGSDDLAAGAPGETIGTTVPAAGAVGVIHGGSEWLDGSTGFVWVQGLAGVPGPPESQDRFGAEVAGADFDGDSYADLAIGVPGEDGGAGLVNVLYGSASGLSGTGDQVFTQAVVGGTAESGDAFGTKLAAVDLNGDNVGDLAIAVPFEDLSGLSDVGLIHVVYGRLGFGLDLPGLQTWHANSPGVPDSNNAGDLFGLALAVGDFDRSGVHDLAIGVPGEAFVISGQTVTEAGELMVLYALDRDTDSFGFVKFESTALSVTEGAGTVLVQVKRGGGAVVSTSVDHVRFGGSATAGTDFAYTPGTLSWAIGDLDNQTIAVTIENDTLDEPDETLLLHLQLASAGTHVANPGGTVTLTIEDDDFGGVIRFAQSELVVEEDAGGVLITVERIGGFASGVGVSFATANGTALAGSDYAHRSGTVSFAAGQLSNSIFVSLIDDGVSEGTEDFTATLTSPTGGAILGTPSTVRIVIGDNDPFFSDGFESGDTSAWSSVGF